MIPGFALEHWYTLSYNLKAIWQGKTARARVNTELGLPPTDPVDIYVKEDGSLRHTKAELLSHKTVEQIQVKGSTTGSPKKLQEYVDNPKYADQKIVVNGNAALVPGTSDRISADGIESDTCMITKEQRARDIGDMLPTKTVDLGKAAHKGGKQGAIISAIFSTVPYCWNRLRGNPHQSAEEVAEEVAVGSVKGYLAGAVNSAVTAKAEEVVINLGCSETVGALAGDAVVPTLKAGSNIGKVGYNYLQGDVSGKDAAKEAGMEVGKASVTIGNLLASKAACLAACPVGGPGAPFVFAGCVMASNAGLQELENKGWNIAFGK